MFCPYCGTEMIEGALYCSKCGKKMPESFLKSSLTDAMKPEIQSYIPNYTMMQLEQVLILQLNTYRICHGVGCLSRGDVFYQNCAECTKDNLLRNVNAKESKDVSLIVPDNMSTCNDINHLEDYQTLNNVTINNYDRNNPESLSGDLYHDCQIMTNIILSQDSNKDENNDSFSLSYKDFKNVSIVADILGNNLVISLTFYS